MLQIFFLRIAPFLDWFVMWKYPCYQIFNLIQPIVKTKTCMQQFNNFMQQICCKFFLWQLPHLDWFLMWNYYYSKIFTLIQLIVTAKTYMQHFDKFMQQIYSIMLQKIFLRCAPLLDLFATWNCPNTQIFSLIQLIVKAKTFMQHFPSFMQQICSIMLQFFVFEMSTSFRLVCLVKLPLFLNFYLNTTNCKGKYLYAAFW